MSFWRKYWGLALVIFLSIFSILPLFHPGFFPMHDDTQVARVFEMGKALRDGMFPVRWVADLGYGYGYPIFNFYAPLAYYVGGFFNVLGFDALISTKIMMGIGIIFSGISMYFLAKEFWGKLGGIISTLFYVYAPYHALDIYVRGDVGELWAYAFIPLMFLGFYNIFISTGKLSTLNSLPAGRQGQLSTFQLKWVIIGSIGFAGVILSHNLTAMMVTPFLIAVLVFSFIYGLKRNKFSIFNSQLSIILLGILLSAFYWLPALSEMKYTNVLSQIGGGADFRNHFVCINQLWDSPWGFGGSVPGCLDGLSFKIGKLHLILLLISCIFTLLILLKKKFSNLNHSNDSYHHSDKAFFIFAITGFILSAFFTLEISKPIWEAISLMAFFQYPWRFLLLISFFSSFIAGSIIILIRQINLFIKYDRFITVSLFILLISSLLFFNLKLFNPQTQLNKNNNDYTNNLTLNWTASKISDEYMPDGFSKPKFQEAIAKNRLIFPINTKVNSLVNKTQSMVLNLDVSNKTNFFINLAYFPAWKLFVNGEEEKLIKTSKGYAFSILPGNKLVEIRFVETPMEKIGNLLSLTGIAMLIIAIIYINKNKNFIK